MKKYKQNESKKAPLQKVTLEDIIREALSKTKFNLKGRGAETAEIEADYSDAVEAVAELLEQTKERAYATMVLELASRWQRGVNVSDLDRLVEKYTAEGHADDDRTDVIDFVPEEDA